MATHSNPLSSPGADTGRTLGIKEPGSNSPIQEVLQLAEQELRQLIRQRIVIARRILTTKQTIVGLAKLFGDDSLTEELRKLVGLNHRSRQTGFTKACRAVLMKTSAPMSTSDICEQVQPRTPRVRQGQQDLSASATTVLNRLVHYGEASKIYNESGRRLWQWRCEGHTNADADS